MNKHRFLLYGSQQTDCNSFDIPVSDRIIYSFETIRWTTLEIFQTTINDQWFLVFVRRAGKCCGSRAFDVTQSISKLLIIPCTLFTRATLYTLFSWRKSVCESFQKVNYCIGAFQRSERWTLSEGEQRKRLSTTIERRRRQTLSARQAHPFTQFRVFNSFTLCICQLLSDSWRINQTIGWECEGSQKCVTHPLHISPSPRNSLSGFRFTGQEMEGINGAVRNSNSPHVATCKMSTGRRLMALCSLLMISFAICQATELPQGEFAYFINY